VFRVSARLTENADKIKAKYIIGEMIELNVYECTRISSNSNTVKTSVWLWEKNEYIIAECYNVTFFIFYDFLNPFYFPKGSDDGVSHRITGFLDFFHTGRWKKSENPVIPLVFVNKCSMVFPFFFCWIN
jgi:hypothetical protein